MDFDGSGIALVEMVPTDLDDVYAAEAQVYSHPWTLGNFSDALDAGNRAYVWRDGTGRLIGYAMLMLALDEIHLLNLAIAREFQGKGNGRRLLAALLARAEMLKARLMLLEVRISNSAALALYDRAGFRRIGMRKGYYPTGSGREDALVLERAL